MLVCCWTSSKVVQTTKVQQIAKVHTILDMYCRCNWIPLGVCFVGTDPLVVAYMNTGVRFYLFSTVIAIQPMMTVLRSIPFCISCPLTNESLVSCHRQPSMRGFDYFVIVEGLNSWVNKRHNDAKYHPVVIYGNEIMVPMENSSQSFSDGEPGDFICGCSIWGGGY